MFLRGTSFSKYRRQSRGPPDSASRVPGDVRSKCPGCASNVRRMYEDSPMVCMQDLTFSRICPLPPAMSGLSNGLTLYTITRALRWHLSWSARFRLSESRYERFVVRIWLMRSCVSGTFPTKTAIGVVLIIAAAVTARHGCHVKTPTKKRKRGRELTLLAAQPA